VIAAFRSCPEHNPSAVLDLPDGRRWKKIEEDAGKKVETSLKIKYSKVVGDALGTLMGVQRAQKYNSEVVTTKKTNFPNTHPK